MIQSKKRNVKQSFAVLVGSVASLAASITAHAVFVALPDPTAQGSNLLPGTGDFSALGSPGVFSTPGSILAILNFPVTVANGNAFTFKGTEIVWKETATGNLTFLYQVEDISGNSIKRITITGFGGYTTEIETDNRIALPGPLSAVGDLSPKDPIAGRNPGTLINTPTSSDRVTSNVVGFDFDQVTDHDIDPGEASKWIAIRTNAKEPIQLSGFLNAIDGGVAFVNVLIPQVPEPTTALFGVTLCGLIASGRLGRARQRTSTVS